MLELIITVLFFWLFFKSLGLILRLTWGITKFIVSVLFTIAFPLLGEQLKQIRAIVGEEKLIMCNLFPNYASATQLGISGEKDGMTPIRLVTAWGTQEADVDAILEAVARLLK